MLCHLFLLFLTCTVRSLLRIRDRKVVNNLHIGSVSNSLRIAWDYQNRYGHSSSRVLLSRDKGTERSTIESFFVILQARRCRLRFLCLSTEWLTNRMNSAYSGASSSFIHGSHMECELVHIWL